MSKYVFIFGAGASKHCGAPLMDEFINVSRTLFEGAHEFKPLFDAINYLQRIHSKTNLDLYNIESIFNLFEMSKLLGGIPGYNENKIDDLIVLLKKLIVNTLEAKTKYQPNAESILPKAPEMYHALFNRMFDSDHLNLKQEDLAFITFNYDLALDLSLTLFVGDDNFDYFLKQEKIEGEVVEGRKFQKDKIPLLKLHGSLNWGVILNEAEGGKPISGIDPIKLEFICREPEAQRNKNVINVSRYLSSAIGRKRNYDIVPLIVPPAWNKSQYHEQIQNVWKKAAEELSDAEHIFIIGYSMPETDSFFKLLFGLGTINGPTLKTLAVINCDKEETQSRFESFLGPGSLTPFEYITKRFNADSINKIAVIIKKDIMQ